jgi:hypothetical protein
MSLRRVSRLVGPVAALGATLLVACGLEVVGTATVTGPTPDATVPSLPEAGPEPVLDASVDVDAGCREDGGCAEAGGAVTLSVVLSGAGAGTSVASTANPLLACPGTCTGAVAPGTKVTLTSTAALGTALLGWSVASCGREPTCEVTVNGPLTVTASFAPLRTYVHDDTKLYVVDTLTGALSTSVSLSNCGSTYYDMAIDRTGAAVFASQFSLFTLSVLSGTCTNLKPISDGGGCSGLTFMPDPLAPATDALFAACGDSLYRLDRTSGQRTLVGAFGGGSSISGDLAWIPGKGLYGTFTKGGADDAVAKVDPLTGQLSGAVSAARGRIFGLARRGSSLLAFAKDDFFVVDPDTGVTTSLSTPSITPLGGAAGP